MSLIKLETIDAFVVRDLGVDVPALGRVRSAPKILQSGARELARAQTYQCAVFNMKAQGASAGINASPVDRPAAIAAFVEQVIPLASTGELMLDPAKGIPVGALDSLLEADPRNDAHRRIVNGLCNPQHLIGLGSVASAAAACGLDGKRIAIDHYEETGPAVAAAAVERGAKITAIGTASGTVLNDDGFDLAALTQALAEHGADMVNEFAEEPLSSSRILSTDVDTLFAGSKMGLLNHHVAPTVKASMVVATGPIPYTTKGALMLEEQGTTVLPGMVTTAGAMFASMPPNGDSQEAIESSVVELLGTLTTHLVNQPEVAVLEACHRAESFMKTWLDELPFGRPFAP